MNGNFFRSQLLDELSGQTPPPLGSLVPDSEADGTRMRRNRRAAQMFAGAAGVTAIAFTAAWLTQGIGRIPTASAGSRQRPARSSPAISPPNSALAKSDNTVGTLATEPTANLPPNWESAPVWMRAPSPAVEPKDPVLATGAAIASLLEQLLPDGGAAVQHAAGYGDDTTSPSSQHIASADLFWEKATIAIRVFQKGEGSPLGCAKEMKDCADYKLPDGTHVNIWTSPGRNTPDEIKSEKTTQYVSLLRPDGTEITVMQINGRENGNFGADRTDMPLTQQQMYAIASDPRWSTTMDVAFVHTANATVQVGVDPY